MAKRIAMISEHASPLSAIGGVDSGGQNVYVAQLSRHLAKAGYRVDIFTRRDGDELPEVVDWVDGVRVVHVDAGPAAFVRKEELLPFMGEFTDYMLCFFERQPQGYDLMHANFWMSGLVAANIKHALDIPFVITFHALGRVRRLYQGNSDEFPDERFDIEDRIIADADAIIAECPQDEQDLIDLYGADPGRIRMIPAGFDPQELSPVGKLQARRLLGFDPDERIILQLGRMVPRKGIETVVRGLGRLIRDHGVMARLLVVGGGSEKPDAKLTPEIGRLQKIAAEEGIADCVTFAGRRNRDVLKYYYSLADVFITLPWYEPFGMTPLEAMGCGTPVIGANVGGIKYSVVHGETGYLVPPQNPQAVGDCLAHLFRNSGLLARLGEQAHARAMCHFTWEKIVEQMSLAYEQVMEDVVARTSSRQNHDARERALIENGFEAAINTFQQAQQVLPASILAASQAINKCLADGGKLLVCGNGGSAADAQHMAAELVGRFKIPHRRALPALALTADTVLLTAWANDVAYDQVFSRQVEAFGQPGDVLIGISTSGRSKNVHEAFKTADRLGLNRIGILGGDGGDIIGLSNVAIVVPTKETARIQEVHLLIFHLLCELVEQRIGAVRARQSSERHAKSSTLEH
jgi:D-inositol-3-phosphate glycosyltransferase